MKGRLVTLEFKDVWVVATYVPNAGEKLKVNFSICCYAELILTIIKNLDVKEEWSKHFEKYIRDLDASKPVIWAGDLNVAPTELGKIFFLASMVYDIIISSRFDACQEELEQGARVYSLRDGSIRSSLESGYDRWGR